MALITLPFMASIAFFFAPSSVEASIFSFVTNIFKAEAATNNEELITNSQKMPLLEAPVRTAMNTGAVFNIKSEGEALVAEEPANASGSSVVSLASNKITTYKIQSGDTISEIAEKFGVSSNTILWANNLKRTSTLTVGKTLVILPISGVQHKVVAGDTLLSLAKKYKADAAEIKDFNGLEADKLKVGDTIVIPDGELSPTLATSPTVKTSAPKIQPKASATSQLASVALGVSVASADIAPIDGYYARPILAGTRTQGLHGSNGVDLADSCGTTIYASAAGEVIVSENDDGWNGGYGNYVVISHGNGSQTLYAHMQQSLVAVGTKVTQGQAIGLLGSTGKVKGSTGCHVHFEIRGNGYANPF